jgi:hypothetical protein
MMKETNLLETRLRSWQPRRPSAKLKHRIFLTPADASHRLLVQSLRCLAPAAAAVLTALAAFTQGGAVAGGASRHVLLTGMMGSNQVECLPLDYQQDHNRIARITFDWTNRSESTSSIGSFLPGRTN